MPKKKVEVEAKVEGVLDELSARVGELEATLARKPRWQTSCRLELPGWPAINVQVERRLDLLAHALGTLHRLRGDMLDLELDPFWGGYGIDAWRADLHQRLKTVRAEEALRKLRGLEATTRPLLTEDQKRERRLAEVLQQLEELGIATGE